MRFILIFVLIFRLALIYGEPHGTFEQDGLEPRTSSFNKPFICKKMTYTYEIFSVSNYNWFPYAKVWLQIHSMQGKLLLLHRHYKIQWRPKEVQGWEMIINYGRTKRRKMTEKQNSCTIRKFRKTIKLNTYIKWVEIVKNAKSKY